MVGAAGRLCGWVADKVIWGLSLAVQVPVVQLGAGEVRGLGRAGTSPSQSLPFCEGGIEPKVPLPRGLSSPPSQGSLLLTVGYR